MKILRQSIKDIMAMTRRGIISLVLCVAMMLELLCMIPVYAMAAETASDAFPRAADSSAAVSADLLNSTSPSPAAASATANTYILRFVMTSPLSDMAQTLHHLG